MTETIGAHDEQGQEPSRRDFIYIAAGGTAAVGGGLVAWPFVHQMNPARDTLALGSTRVDVSVIEEGAEITIMWRGAPVFVRRRTATEISEAQNVELGDLPDPDARNDNLPEGTPGTDANRVLREEFLIVKGNCTHLGCVPLGLGANTGDYDGWYCPCHGSHYDTSARIRRGPAPENLPVPDYYFETDAVVKIGLNDDEKANSGWAVA